MIVSNIHASCVVLMDAAKPFEGPEGGAVLLLGASGSGKSDLALRMIQHGAKLVADHRVELFIANGALMARAPASLAGMIEGRGVGIVTVPFWEQARIVLAVELIEAGNVPRMPEREFYIPPPELNLPDSARPPLIWLSAFEASAPAKISLAAAAFAKGLFREQRNP